MKTLRFFLILWLAPLAFAQTATVNWTNVHQPIAGFGASDESQHGSMPSTCGAVGNCQNFFFNTLGLSLLRVGVTNGSQEPGSCASIGSSCAGNYTGDMTAMIAAGGKVYATPWSPPAGYTYGNTTICSSGNSTLNTADYASYATWFSNFYQSLVADGITLSALGVQNEPDQCHNYDSSIWSATSIDTFAKTNLGPTLPSVPLVIPEAANYGALTNSDGGGTCATDPTCSNYVGVWSLHDYQATGSGYTVNPATVPSGWASGKQWWMTEVSCGSGYGPYFCPGGFNTSMTSALNWAALIDQRMQDGVSAFLFWQFIAYSGAAPTTDYSLMSNSSGGYAVTSRAYVLGQYAKCIRPGFYRIDATHIPQAGVTVSAYQNTSTNQVCIVATNYGSAISQTFNLTNAPTFTTLTPTITSASQNMQTQSAVSVSGNSVTYTLPAGSVTTFSGTASSGTTYTLSTSITSGSGTVTPSSGSFAAGAGYSLSISPAAGYVIGSVTGCGGSGTSTYTGSMPAASCVVSISFAATSSQLWSGLCASNRCPSNDWPNAGAGAIPARATICTTLGTSGQAPTYVQSVSASQIMSALSSCPSGQTVFLNTGTYALTAPLQPTGGNPWPSNVTLRGAGPQNTIILWLSSTTFGGCNGNQTGLGGTLVCLTNGDSGLLQFSANILTVTAGMTQGSTTVTLGAAPTGTLCPNTCSGSVSNLAIGSLITFNQLDDSSDNGNWFVCGTGGTTGTCSQQGVANAWNYKGVVRAEMQTVTVTGISGNNVTFTPAIYAPNWTSVKAPYATFSSKAPLTGAGIENLQFNTQQIGDFQAMLEFNWASKSWVQNVAFVNNDGLGAAARKHIEASGSSHISMLNSYFFGSQPSSEGYGTDMIWGTCDALIQNNIFHHMASATMTESACGNVFGYNYDADNFYTGGGSDDNWQQCDAFHHDDGDYYNLWEGHEGICWSADDIHGTSAFNTAFRSYFNGRDPANQCPGGGTACGTGVKNQNTEAIQKLAYARYDNLFLNVLGTPGYFNTYQNAGISGQPTVCPSYNYTAIYSDNFGGANLAPISPACNGANWTLDNDSLVTSSMVRWGNLDTVNGSVQTNSGETASGASTYPGLSSPNTTWASYPSFYLTSTPSWWVFPNGTAAPWPAVGAGVTGATAYSGIASVYHNPAANCYLNVLYGLTNGSSGPLPFDANNCYSGGTSTAPTPTFLPAAGTYASTQTVNLAASPCNAYIVWNTTGATSGGNLTGTTTGTSVTVSSSETVYAQVQSCPTYNNSSIGAANYSISSPTLAAPTFSPLGVGIPDGNFLSNPTVTITAPPVQGGSPGGTSYYLSPSGSDSNNGLSTGAPWLTPNHALNCGDTITAAASSSYSGWNFWEGEWGTVTCSGTHGFATLKCATFDGCIVNTSSGTGSFWVDKSHWLITGFEVQGSTAASQSISCFVTTPNTTTPASIYDVAFVDDIANGCLNGGFTAYNYSTTYSVDYIAYVGDIAYNASQGTASCTSGFNVYQPIAHDTAAGTHIYIGGNFSYANFDPATCNSGPSTDGEGIIVDTLDFSQGGGTAYTQQAAVENNIAVGNGSNGIQVFNNQAGGTHAPVYVSHNTLWGNMRDTHQTKINAGELQLNTTSNTQASQNLVQTSTATGLGGNPIYALSVETGDATDSVFNTYASGVSGNNTVIYSSGAFAYGPGNTIGTTVTFNSATVPGAPLCSSFASTVSCMATVIANFTPTNSGAAAYGYQTPSTAPASDPLFPQWLCSNGALLAGLVTPSCQAAVNYTTDGSTPTSSHGTAYSAPFALTINPAGVNLQAVAFQTGYTASPVASSTYYQRNIVVHSTCNNGASAGQTLSAIGCTLMPLSGDGISCRVVLGSSVPSVTVADNVNAGNYTPVSGGQHYYPGTFASIGNYYYVAPAAGRTVINAAFSQSAQYTGLDCKDLEPASAGTFTLDTAFLQQQDQASTTAPTTGAAVLPSLSNEIVICGLEAGSRIPTRTVTPYYTSDSLSGGPNLFTQYQIQTTATSSNCPFTMPTADATTDQQVAFSFASSAQAAIPVLSPSAGTYSTVPTITLTCSTASPTMYFTEDGSTPTTSSTQYTMPFTLSSSATVKAICTASGFSQSSVGSAVYTVNAGLTSPALLKAVPAN